MVGKRSIKPFVRIQIHQNEQNQKNDKIAGCARGHEGLDKGRQGDKINVPT